MMVALIALSLYGGQPHNPAHDNTKTTQKIDQAAPAQTGTKSSTDENSASNQTPSEVPWYEDAAKATWWLVGVGIAGTVAAFLTLIFIRMQTEVAASAAKAALTNAQAVINAERPWIFVHWEKNAPRMHTLVMQNHGKTPAEIVDVYQAVRALPLSLNRVELPDVPKYLDTMLFTFRMLAPSEKWSPAEWFIDVDPLLPEADKLNSERLYFYGRVRYRDTFDKRQPWHESRFCFFWSPPRDDFLPGGPPDYNKHT